MKGFLASDLGMGGQGAYFTILPPSKQIGSASWPSLQFRENVLEAHYGDDWENPSRQQNADAVVVCFVDQDVSVSVRLGWRGVRGRLCPERYIDAQSAFVYAR